MTSPQKESLLKRISKAKDSINSNPEIGLKMVLQLYDEMKETINYDAIGRLCKLLGTFYLRKGNPQLGIEYYQQALANFELEDNYLEIGNIYNNLIVASHKIKKQDELEEFSRLALLNYEKCGNVKNITSVINNMAKSYTINGLYQKSYLLLKDAKDKYAKVMSWKDRIILSTNYANVCLKLDKVQEGLDLLETLSAEAKKEEAYDSLATISLYLSEYYESIGDFKTALAYQKNRTNYLVKVNHKDISEDIGHYLNTLNIDVNELSYQRITKQNDVLVEAHKQAKQKNGFLETLINTIPFPLYYSDMNDRYLGCNDSYCNFYKLDKNEIIGKQVGLSLSESAEVELFAKKRTELKEKRKPHRFITKVTPTESDLRTIELFQNVFYNEAGELAGILGLVRDITDDIKKDKELIQFQETLEAIFNNAQVGILLVTKDLEFKLFNPYFSELMNYSFEEIEEKGFELFIDNCADTRAIIKAKASQGVNNFTAIKSFQTKNNKDITIQLEVTFLRDSSNNVENYLVILKDITESLEQQNINKKINAHLYSVLESSPSAYICSIDRNYRYTYFNKNYADGVERNWKVKINIGDHYFRRYETEEEKREKTELIEWVLQGHTECGIRDFTDIGRDEIFQWHYSPIVSEDGEIIGVTAFSYDITDRILAQRELALANITKDKFFSIIAHDLRSPIGNIKAALEFITEDKGLSNSEVKEMLKQLADSAVNTFDLLENLLQWSLNQRGRLDYESESFQLLELIEKTVKLSKNISHSKQITIEVDCAPDLSVYADKNMFFTILRNLINNAIKYSHEKGKIIVAAQRDKDYALIRVIDHGVGIKAEIIPHLNQLDKTISTYGTNGERGSGLGLVLCHELIAKLHGQLWIESEEGKGSVFSFTIPVNDRTE
ncbi:MAG: PAS domain-containing protein [Candidatus Cloacimonadales bacterium]